MNDIRRQHPEHPEHPERPERPQQPHTVFDKPVETPPPEIPERMPRGAGREAGLPDKVSRTLWTIKWVVVAILTIALAAGLYLVGTRLLDRKTPGQPVSDPATVSSPVPAPTGAETGVGDGPYPEPSRDAGTLRAQSVSCLSQTGPDATTTSRQFVDVPGTGCTYSSGQTGETLVLNGKLNGRNTEGTGLSVTINVNGKDCNGGETLSYARVYTPMQSNCTFVVPANAKVDIKWRFLSPFGGTAAILRSSKNIAPSINGIAISNASDQP